MPLQGGVPLGCYKAGLAAKDVICCDPDSEFNERIDHDWQMFRPDQPEVLGPYIK